MHPSLHAQWAISKRNSIRSTVKEARLEGKNEKNHNNFHLCPIIRTLLCLRTSPAINAG